MREILFRGRGDTKYNDGVWYYGVPIRDFEGDWQICTNNSKRVVIPETIGQYTGLIDKNGKKIFEGDIVHILGNQDVSDLKSVNYNALIAFLDGGFCAIDGTIEEHAIRRYAPARMGFDLEIIGNIYDNPELIGGEINA